MPDPARVAQFLPARALRRHGAARADRDGADQPPGARDRRRRHQRARRHRAAPGARPDGRPDPPEPRLDADDHPRARHRRAVLPARDGHLRRSGLRGRGHAPAVRQPAAPLHPEPARDDPPAALGAARAGRCRASRPTRWRCRKGCYFARAARWRCPNAGSACPRWSRSSRSIGCAACATRRRSPPRSPPTRSAPGI